jgi:DNA repair protein RecO (recombination protein O)
MGRRRHCALRPFAWRIGCGARNDDTLARAASRHGSRWAVSHQATAYTGGTYIIEPIQLRTDRFLSNRAALCGLNYLSTLIRLLPERDPHEALYLSLEVIIDALHDVHIAAPLLVRFELLMLQELGFGLDLTSCALSGKTYDLAFVSPKSGRAVAGFAAGEWASRLLPLPAFCAGPAALPSNQCLSDGFALTHYFLNRNIYEPRGLEPPDSRAQYITLI